MDLRAFYQELGGNYEDVMSRLRQEERVVKFLRLFPADENFGLLAPALAGEDWQTAFRAAHSLKGMALNLSLTALARSASDLTELLRSGAPQADPQPLYERLSADYQKTLAAIGQLA